MTAYSDVGGLKVAESLYRLVSEDIIPGTGVDTAHFWSQLEQIISDLGPANKTMMDRRDELQEQIDAWHKERQGQSIDAADYQQFLRDIGYLVAEGDDFSVKVDRVDPEIATLAGPQLVVPVNNARYALNAANARWGSLYDALYGTDAISHNDGAESGSSYNPVRGSRVVAWANAFLDSAVPLANGHYESVAGFSIESGKLVAAMVNGGSIGLQDADQFAGYTGDATNPTTLVLRNNGLHLEIQIDREHVIGRESAAGIKDVLLEAALTTIQDCEDSVAAVDADDKTLVYRNWLGLMRGDLADEFKKGDATVTRKLNPDRRYTAADGGELSLPGRSVLLVRNVGAHMYTDIVLDASGNEVPECYVDAMITSLAAMHDLKKSADQPRNSREGSVYIVKPKQHGPEERWPCRYNFSLVLSKRWVYRQTRLKSALWTKNGARP